MAFRFEDLQVWHLAADLSNEVDLLAKLFLLKKDLAWRLK